MRDELAALPDATTRGSWCRAAGIDLMRGEPVALSGTAREQWVDAFDPWTPALGPDAREWFGLAGARYLALGARFGAARARLEALARQRPDGRYEFERATLLVDCLLQLDQLAEARQRVAQEPAAANRSQRINWLAQKARVDTALGCLDLAALGSREAQHLAADMPLADPTRFNTLLTHLDLLTAREQFDEALAAIAELRAADAVAGTTLTAPHLHALAKHGAAALFHLAHRQRDRLPEAAAELARLEQDPATSPVDRQQLRIQRADAALLADDPGLARTLLTDLDRADLPPRVLRMLVPVEARLALVRGESAADLNDHRQRLQKLLDTMIGNWTAVADQTDSTGFLRLAERLRVVGELTAIATAVDGPAAGLAVALQAQRCTTLSRRRQVGATTVAAIQRDLLSAVDGALVFVPCWQASFTFAIDGAGVHAAPLAQTPRLRQLLDDFRVELAALDTIRSDDDPQLARTRGLSRELAGLLLPPAIQERMRAWRTVAVSGAGLLRGLPVECLELPDGALLGERFAVTTITSLPLAVELARDAAAHPRSANPRVHLFATLTPDPEFAARNNIAAADAEPTEALQHLADRAGAHAAVRLGAAATVSGWRQACQQDRADLAVLLAHGEQPTAASPPALGMTPDPQHTDGLLTPDLVHGLPQPTIVVLSACYGSRGPSRTGDDELAATLAGAFVRAGSTAVVSSAAPLRLSLHAAIAGSLLEELAAGTPIAVALQRARTSAASDRLGAYRAGQIHVFGWGGAAIAAERTTPRWPWALVGLVLLVGGALTLRHRRRRRAMVAAR